MKSASPFWFCVPHLSIAAGIARAADADKPLYRDASQPIEKRVADLLGRMTLEEKVGQMNMPCVYVGGLGRTIAQKMEGRAEVRRGHATEGFRPGRRFLHALEHDLARRHAAAGGVSQPPPAHRAGTNAIGHSAAGDRGGHARSDGPGATIFPEGPSLGSTWNIELIGRVYATVAKEARSIGVHQNFTLVVEPIRDPRLGRNEEAFSEDPFLCSRIAETIARSMQGNDLTADDHVVSGLCHYPGQSQPVSGLERGAMEISDRTLREVFLPSWQAGIKNGGALGVMATYPAIDGVPTHASEKLLTRILRDEFGFDGLVLVGRRRNRHHRL